MNMAASLLSKISSHKFDASRIVQSCRTISRGVFHSAGCPSSTSSCMFRAGPMYFSDGYENIHKPPQQVIISRQFSEIITDKPTTGNEKHSDDSEIPTEKHGLYDGHIPTTFLQKSLLSVGAAAMAITNPWRGDMVATMGETTAQLALPGIRRKMMEDVTGRRILEERPRINTRTVNLEYLRSLPDGTFGRTYVVWLDRHGCSPDERLPVQFVDDPDLAYVMQRYREVHDLFHAVLGMPTNMLGEVAVKWVEALQLGLPMCALGALFGPVRFGPKHMQKYLQTYMWWAIQNGTQAKFLMNVYFEEHWGDNLEDLQQELNIQPLPSTSQEMRR